MSTLRVDKIKSRTGTTVTIPDSHNLTVTGALTISGTSSYGNTAQLNLQGTNINSATRGDILYYDNSGQIAKLNIGASGSVLKSDGTDVAWGSIGGATNVYYVATNGTDAAGRGGSIDTAFKTLKYACSNIGTPTAVAPAIIIVKSGVYAEVQLPIIVPQYTTIAGDSLRSTIVKPGAGLDSGGSILNTRSTLFRCSNATIIQDLVLDGMGGYQVGSPAYDPDTGGTLGGVYFALNSASAITDKSPYIYNVTSFGAGATGAYVDGALHASGSRSMLFHTYTAVHEDGVAVWAKDRANCEIISGFTYFCQIGFVATGGSEMRVLNSSNSYGEYGIYSKGYDATETPNGGTVKGIMLTYANVLSTNFTLGEQITGGTSGATAYVANVQTEPKTMYIVGKTGTFQNNEVITGGTSSTTATLAAANAESNQSGRILVTSFTTAPDDGDSLKFASVDTSHYQIQNVTSQTANSVVYKVIVFSTSRPTPVPDNTAVETRKQFTIIRLTGHDFLKVGTGAKNTTNWPGEPTQAPDQADQIVTTASDPGRVYYVATDDLGNFYVGEYFKVDQATGNVTLDASAFNLKGLQTLQLGAIGGLVGAQINEFSTDTTLAQNSDEKVPTQKAIKTYIDTQLSGSDLDFQGDSGGALSIDLDTEVLSISGTANEIETAGSGNSVTIGLPNNVTLGGDLTVGGNDIKSSTATAITLSGADVSTAGNLACAGDLTVTGNDIKASGGTTAITLSGANVTVAGNLTVTGGTTTVSSTTIEVTDKNLELGKVASPSDTTADGGGITLKGASDKTINWVNSTDCWTANQSFDLASTKAYRINNALIVDATTLGSSVVNSSLQNVGTLSSLTVSGNLTVSTGTLSVPRLVTNEVIERTNIDSGGGIQGTMNLDLVNHAVHYFDTDSVGDWTWNARGDGSTTLNSLLGNAESLTFACIVDHGGTSHRMTGFQIDGSNVLSSINWAGGSAPGASDAKANGVSTYHFTIIKRSSGNYRILASFTAYED